MNEFESPVEGLEKFPSFAPLFGADQHWLRALHLPSGDPLAEIKTAVSKTKTGILETKTEILEMFANRNHRCHLVAGAALLCGGADEGTVAALWRTLDAGTWAAAQLAACAYLVDPQFDANARRRMSDAATWPKLRGALFGLDALDHGPPLALLAAAGRALEAQEAKDGRHYALQWLRRIAEVSAPEDRARWQRSPPPADRDTPA
jgi:hypothetical protein